MRNMRITRIFILGGLIFFITSFYAIQVSASNSRGNSRDWPGNEEAKNLHSDNFSELSIPMFDSVHPFDALHYRLDLDFPMQSSFFSGEMTLTFRVVSDSLSQIVLDMVHLVTDSVFIGNVPTAATRDDTTITIPLNGYHRADETLMVKIFYHDTGVQRGFNYYGRNAYTFAEPLDARWWFPCFDEPWDKATSEIYCTVPDTFKVGSNGTLASADHNIVNHTVTYHWVNEYPIATYLINLIIGVYSTWNDYYINPQGDSIPLFYMVFPEDSAKAAYDFATVPDMLTLFSDLFGPYPFDKYGMGAVTPAPFGGMEHQTMTTINRDWIDGLRTFDLAMAHELSHQWWGDLVTLADWRNIWLNEGFASYASALYNDRAHGHDRFMQNMLDYQVISFFDDSITGGYPIYNPSPDRMFSYSVYYKGAWVLHMLRGVIGDSAFFAGLHQYAARYAYSNASTDEFRDVMESYSGVNLHQFFHDWIYEQHFPEYEYAWSFEPYYGDFMVHLEIAQVQTNAPIFKMPLSIKIISDGIHDFIVNDSLEYQEFDLRLSGAPTNLLFDPDNWVLDKDRQVNQIPGHEHQLLPIRVDFERMYPNPFSISTNIPFSVRSQVQEVGFSIYDILGRKIKKYSTAQYIPGHYILVWDGRDDDGQIVSSGVYLVKLKSSSGSGVRKVTFLK
jgi:aminopeptidase N